jgi:hypothetical protein
MNGVFLHISKNNNLIYAKKCITQLTDLDFRKLTLGIEF